MTDTSEFDAAVDPVREIEFAGQTFRLAEQTAAMPLLKLARMAVRGTEANTMQGLAALLDFLEQAIHPDDWARFDATATDSRAGGDHLLAVVQKVMAGGTGRPTSQPSDSSDGLSTTTASLKDASPSRVSSIRPVSHVRDMAQRHGWPMEDIETLTG